MANHACFHGGHDDSVFLYFADDHIESRSVLLLCLHHVTSHSKSRDSVFSFIKYTREIKVTASVKNVFTRGKSSAGRDFNGE